MTANRKAHPGIYVQNGTRFPLEAPNGNRIPDFALKLGYGFPLAPSTGNCVPESELKTGRTFRSRYSNASAQAASLKPGIAKSSPTSSGRLTSMPSVASSS